MNPVRANMVELPIDYSWSSYRVYMDIQQDPLVTTEKTLGYFSAPKVDRYRLYVEGASKKDSLGREEIQ